MLQANSWIIHLFNTKKRSPQMASPLFESNDFFLKCLWMSKQHTEQMGSCTEGRDCLEARATGLLFRVSSTIRSWLQLRQLNEKRPSSDLQLCKCWATRPPQRNGPGLWYWVCDKIYSTSDKSFLSWSCLYQSNVLFEHTDLFFKSWHWKCSCTCSNIY